MLILTATYVEHDFGPVPARSVLMHRFVVQNNSTVSIELVAVRSNCNCSTADGIAGTVLAPGAQCDIPVTLRATEDEERQIADIILTYRVDGRPSEQVAFRVAASPQPDYRTSPPGRFVDFGRLDGSSSPVRKYELQHALDPTVRIVSASSTDSRIAVKMTDEGRAIEIAPTRLPGDCGGSLSALVVCKTTSLHQPTFAIFIQADYEQLVTVSPKAIVLPSGLTGDVTSEVIVKHKIYSIDFQEVQSSRSDVSFAIIPTLDGSGMVRVIVPAVASGVLRGELTLRFKPCRDGYQIAPVVVPLFRFGQTP